VYAQLEYDHLKLNDELDAAAVHTNRHLDTWTLSLTGDVRDGLGSGGVSTASLNLTAGRTGFDNTAAQLLDASSTRTEGRFFKYDLSLARLQRLTASDAFYLLFAGQWTSDNLDSSQKAVAGGPYSVRAYDLGAIAGDTSSLVSAELQHDLGRWWAGGWQALAFFDFQHVIVNKNAFAPGPNSATLKGAGAGLAWAGPHRWTARVTIAARIASEPVLVPHSSSARVWAELNREF
jgi:hemolysin activation/secretion protein